MTTKPRIAIISITSIDNLLEKEMKFVSYTRNLVFSEELLQDDHLANT